MIKGRPILTLLALTALLAGCTHPLTITNLDNYTSRSVIAMDQRLRIGIRATATDLSGHRLIHAIGRDLLKYNAECTTAVDDEKAYLDVIAQIAVTGDQQGSGWNFLTEFPGFLIWTPAWNGYSYEVAYDIDVNLNDAKTGKLINTIHIPVRLNVKHADISRTWTDGVSWFTLGVPSLIGGLVYMNYDESLTPLVDQKAGPTLSNYAAQQIALCLHYYKSAPRDRFERLKRLLDEEYITQEEYDLQRQTVIESL